jgi:murein endopeptidase
VRALVIVIALASVAQAKPHARKRLSAVKQRTDAPWRGRLDHASQFPDGEGYFIRRPWRTFATKHTIELAHEVIAEQISEFSDRHVLAIGDFSAEHGGPITEHASHQNGHDVDIGLYYTEKPQAYPESFVTATEDNLDCEATYALVDRFVRSGGASIIFLDYNVQGILYRWAKENGVAEAHLDRMFQYPHGRGSSEGVVRHWPNHDNHIHVRFR